MRFVYALILVFLVAACVNTPRSSFPGLTSGPGELGLSEESLNDLTVLSAVGGICILGGVLLMVMPGASHFRGLTALVVGVLLVLLNVGVKEYFPYIYIPFVIGTGLVSLVVTYRCVTYLLRNKRKGLPCFLRPLLPSWVRSGSSSSKESSPSSPE